MTLNVSVVLRKSQTHAHVVTTSRQSNIVEEWLGIINKSMLADWSREIRFYDKCVDSRKYDAINN